MRSISSLYVVIERLLGFQVRMSVEIPCSSIITFRLHQFRERERETFVYSVSFDSSAVTLPEQTAAAAAPVCLFPLRIA